MCEKSNKTRSFLSIFPKVYDRIFRLLLLLFLYIVFTMRLSIEFELSIKNDRLQNMA